MRTRTRADDRMGARAARLGKGKGRFRVRRGFDAPLPADVLALFEGGGAE